MLTKSCAREVIQEIINLYPNVETILEYQSNFQLLIAVMLSAQTTDIAVNKVTPALFKDFPNPESFSGSSPEALQPYLKTIGLYRNKAKYVYNMAKKLVTDFDGQVPNNRKDLESLPGVGRKTANVMLSVGFGIPAFAVDTHVTRVLKHHDIVPQDASTRQIEDYIVEILPADQLTQAHQSLIYFGREICHPRNPECKNYPQLYQCLETVE